MYREENKKRMDQIHTLLIEFASGNFLYKLERTELNDDMEALAALVNMTVEEIKDSFYRQSYVNQDEIYGYLIQLFFLLDREDSIKAFTNGVRQLLFFDDSELRTTPFPGFLAPESKLIWTRLKARLTKTNPGIFEEVIPLSFKTKKDLILTTNCLVAKPIGDPRLPESIVVTSVEMVMASKERQLELWKAVQAGRKKKPLSSVSRKKRKKLSATDIPKIRQVHDHILNHLDRPLSSLRQLAHTYGTNEYKLKHGFKELYAQTVFGFLMSERLRKASILVQHSEIPFKEVAHITGFKSAPHFSRAFKEKYGYTPSELRKQSNNR